MSKLLIDDNPLILLPSLATLIGLNEAIFIQQIHYWVQRSTTDVDGNMWSYNTYDELQEQFPFWSVRTIKSIVKSCKENGYLFVENLSKNKRDKTNYYRVNYHKLDTHNSCDHSADVALSDSADVAPSIVQELHDDNSNAETYLETSTEKVPSAKKVAEYLLLKITQNNPEFVVQNINAWIADIDKAMRIDNRTELQLMNCIEWIYHNPKGSFWIPNILSGRKLREKFNTMSMQANQGNAKNDALEKNLKMMEAIQNEK